MSSLTTVTSRGQITIPLKVRELMKIEPGDKVYVQSLPDKKNAVLRVVPVGGVVEELAGALETDKPYVPLEEVRDKAYASLADELEVDK